MRFASLGSGSSGNAWIIESSAGITKTHVMLDCGFSMREIELRMARFELSPTQLSAIFITHEHADHIGSAFTLARKYKIPVYMSWGTAQATRPPQNVTIHYCIDEQPVTIGNLLAHPYTVPHDAREPLQFTFSDGDRRLGILTDAGSATTHMQNALSHCHALVLECNHDRNLLQNNPKYPPSLKQRIGGVYGHLANETAAEILAAIKTPQLNCIVAAHLSRDNNLPELAQKVLASVMGANAQDIFVATQAEGTPWRFV